MNTPDFKERGFTLLELIIAFAILGVVILIIGSGLRIGVKAWEKGEEIVDETQRIRVLWERLSFEIKSTYPYQTEGAVEKKMVFEGKSNSLSFVTTAVGTEGKGGLKWVSYYLKDNGLMLKEKRLPDKELDEAKGEEIILDPGVKDIRFEYYEKNEGDWETSWDSKEKGRLPEVIKVSIYLKQKGSYKKEELPFPPILISVPIAYSAEEGMGRSSTFR